MAGTHGKSTTTAMIAWILEQAGRDPSYIIGGVAIDLGTNAHAGSGIEFVVEADEYDRAFLGLSPSVAVVTNIEHDHPDCYPTPEEFHAAFEAFAAQVQDLLITCADDPGAAALDARRGPPHHLRAACAGRLAATEVRADRRRRLHVHRLAP